MFKKSFFFFYTLSSIAVETSSQQQSPQNALNCKFNNRKWTKHLAAVETKNLPLNRKRRPARHRPGQQSITDPCCNYKLCEKPNLILKVPNPTWETGSTGTREPER